jgi:hypothetical protein
MSRWKSPILRAGIVSLIIFSIKTFGKIEIPNEIIDTLVNVLFIAVFGVSAANNPTDKEKF